VDGLWRSEADVAPARIGTGRRVHNTTNHNTTMTHSLTHWLDVSEKIVAATSVNQANAASALRATSVRLIKRDHRGNGDVHTAVVNNRSLQLPACNIHTVNTEHCVVSFGKSAMQAHLTVAVEGYNGLDPRCTDYSQYCDRPMRAANIRAEVTQRNRTSPSVDLPGELPVSTFWRNFQDLFSGRIFCPLNQNSQQATGASTMLLRRTGRLIGRCTRLCRSEATRPTAALSTSSPYHPAEISAAQIAAAVAQNPSLVNEVEKLVPNEQKKALRHQIKLALGARATAKEFYNAIDKNNDGVVSEQEFAAWWAQLSSSQRAPNRRMQAINQKLGKIKTAQSAATSSRAAVDVAAQGAAAVAAAAPDLTMRQFAVVATVSAIPMIGFGFVDNIIMIVAGDAIDMTLGVTFGLTALAAAGLGNAFSDVCGVYLGGVIETVASKIGVKPDVSQAQLMSRHGRIAASTGGALGIFFGCILGMVPLLFMDHDDRKLTKTFADLDTDKDGKINLAGVKKCLKMNGVRVSEVHFVTCLLSPCSFVTSPFCALFRNIWRCTVLVARWNPAKTTCSLWGMSERSWATQGRTKRQFVQFQVDVMASFLCDGAAIAQVGTSSSN